MRARVTWSLTVPILLAAELFAHGLAYRVAVPSATARRALLQQTGHGYLAWIDLALAISLALAAWALGRRALRAWRGSAVGIAPPRRLALLPPAAFLMQEYVERLVHDGAIQWATVTERPVVIGLALQLVCGLAAVLAVRALLRLAVRAGRALAFATARRRRAPLVQPQILGRLADPPRLLALTGCAAGRAPPATA